MTTTSSAPLGPSAANTSPSPGWTLASLALGMLLPSLGVSIANVALPALAAGFHASFQQAQWVVLAYLLASTSLIVGMGRLGDLAGRRRVMLGGIVLFTAASAVAGLSSELWLLIASRAAQGLGAAAMLALTMALVSEVVPKAHTGRAMGLLGTMSAVGTALGPLMGGLLLAGSGWRAIFLVQVPLGVLAWGLARRHLPQDAMVDPAGPRDFDTTGTLLLALTLAAYALAMTLGGGRLGALNLALLAAAALGFFAFVRSQRRTASPLVQPASLRDAVLRTRLLASGLVATVMMTTLVVGPFYLAAALKLGAAQVGLVLAIGPVVSALSGVPAGRAVDRFGSGRVAVLGLSAMVAGGLALSLTAAGLFSYIGSQVTLTLGYALFQAANNTAVMRGLAPQQRGVVAGLLNLARNLGFITGASVMGAVFAHATGAGDVAAAAPQALAHGMSVAFATAAGLAALALLSTLRELAAEAPPAGAGPR